MRELTTNEVMAYEQGRRAGQESMSMAGYGLNPYKEGTPEAVQWGLGWCRGYAEAP